MALSLGLTDLAFVKEEVSPGVLVPPAGTDGIRLIGDADVSQTKTLVESLERVNSYSLTDLIAMRYSEATFALPFYMKRTGVVDTVVPGIDTVLKNAFGRKTTNAGVDTTYELLRRQDTPLNFSLFFKKGGITLQCAGCFVRDLAFPLQADESEASIWRATATGAGYRVYWAGNTTITEDLTTTDPGLTKFKVLPADLAPSDHATAASIAGKFVVGAYVTVGALTTSHKITDINPTTGEVTVTPVFGSNQLTGSTVQGWTPVESETGEEIAGHKGFVSIDAANDLHFLSGTPHLVMPRRALTEEKNNQEYATADAIEGRRAMTIDTITAYFDPRGTFKHDLLFALADRATRKAIEINVGNETGKKWKLTMGTSIMQNPVLRGDGIVQIQFAARGLATGSLDDEATLKSL